MEKPTFNNFPQLTPLTIQRYESYLPTAFDESMTLLDKSNKIIEFLNHVERLLGNFAKDWETFANYVIDYMENYELKLDTKHENFVSYWEDFVAKVYGGVLIWLEPVQTFQDLALKYPNAVEGNAAMVRRSTDGYSKVYRFTSGTWKLIQSYDGFAMTEIENRIDAQLLTKISKGNVSVADINKNLGKFDQTYMSDAFLAQIAGQAGINVTPGVDSVTTDKVVKQAITKEKLNEFVKATGRNLFSKTDIERNKTVVYNTGVSATDNLFMLTNYIPVLPNTEYNFSRLRSLAFYDASKVYISGVDNPVYNINYARTTPANTAFVRVSFKNEDLEVMQVMTGNLQDSYEPFLYELSGLVVNEKNLDLRLGLVKTKMSQVNAIKQGKNLFNKLDRQLDGYIGFSTGLYIANASYDATDFIRVEPDQPYMRSYAHQMAWYTKDKAFISGITTATGDPNVPQQVISPTNAYYARLSVPKTHLDRFQFEKGSLATPYEKFKLTFDESVFPNEVALKEVVNTGIVSVQKSSEAIPGNNLFNPETITNDMYVNYTNGTLASNVAYVASDFIPVKPETNYMRTHSHMLAFYNESKGYLSGVNSNPDVNVATQFTTPVNAKFIRITAPKAQVASFMVHEGTSLLQFEPYSFGLKNFVYKGSRDEVLIFLPPEIAIAVDRTIELYNKQVVWTGNIKNYHIKWDCAVGSAMDRKWTCKGVTAKIGTYKLTCTVYDGNMKIITSASTNVKITNTTLATSKKLLAIGDSLTNAKPWIPELNVLTGGKIEFVGTRSWTDNGITYNHEGRSGFTANSYLTASAYAFENEGVHPFWNPNTSSFDYGYYKSQTNVNPDAIQIFLGTNGIALDPTPNATNIKTIVDKIRENDLNIPIYVVMTLFRGDQNGMGRQLSTDGYSAGSGVWKLEEDRKVFNLVSKLYDLLKGYTNVRFIPVAQTHDSEYNFMKDTYPVNPRSTITRQEHNEATHPQTPGYLQMADIMYSVWCLYND